MVSDLEKPSSSVLHKSIKASTIKHIISYKYTKPRETKVQHAIMESFKSLTLLTNSFVSTQITTPHRPQDHCLHLRGGKGGGGDNDNDSDDDPLGSSDDEYTSCDEDDGDHEVTMTTMNTMIGIICCDRG